MVKISERKAKYKAHLEKLLAEHKNILLVKIDNVGSNQMQQVRIALRGRAVMLMGKNTIIRRVLKDYLEVNPKLEGLLPYVVGNVGLVFTNEDLDVIRKEITANKVPAAAKSGLVAPCDVIIPPGTTGLDPGQTSFFQALNIATKINRGSIEILNEVELVKKGERVSSSAVALLGKLNVKPFFFGIEAQTVYEDGEIYSAEILDMTDDVMSQKFSNGVRVLAALCLGLHYPTAASMPHLVSNAFKKLLAIHLVTDYKFDAATKVLEAGAAAASAPAGGDAAAGGAAAAAPEPESEPEAEEDAAGVFDDGADY